MSYKIKFSLTVSALIVLVLSFIFLFNDFSEYVTIEQFNEKIKSKEIDSNNKLIIGGQVVYAQNLNLDKLFVNDKKTHAIFNLIDSSEQYVQIVYHDVGTKVDFQVGDNVIVTGDYYESFSLEQEAFKELTNNKVFNLNHIIFSSNLQTKCDSKYDNESYKSE
ncbi:cytochrome c maturation protein CcmE [Candidatus Marinimicrobia bacterium]|nr:cytochrome c maturation protein CcmE [Candidatus Neomarinimicrobiota bacterium]